ncbi:hypothetical protein EVAR_31042_1 [Eumeta japonica]|uniref:C-type lectin domain-containing protein n=1 Tax=Eumeta variegata TaxID=151549 RepID=A0A4C1VGB5_EUMVA|nr:hypothetical protein EVAR_31042_1 [Eumeta japonica]
MHVISSLFVVFSSSIERICFNVVQYVHLVRHFLDTEISHHYAPWDHEEYVKSDDTNDRCVILHRDGSIAQEPCDSKRAFVCKKYGDVGTRYGICGTSDTDMN